MALVPEGEPTHVTVTLALPLGELENFEKAEEYRHQLGERAWAAALRQLDPYQPPDHLKDADADS